MRFYLVLPPIVCSGIMGCFALDFLRQSKEGPGDRKLAFNLLYADAVVNQGKEPGILGSLEQLGFDLILAVIKVCVLSVNKLFYTLPMLRETHPSRRWMVQISRPS